MEEKKSILGGVCLNVPTIEPEKMKGVSIIEETPSPVVLFDVDKHFTIGQGDNSLPYSQTYGSLENIKWGQMKLLAMEVDFLDRYWDPIFIPNPQVVYIGAAPGTHIGLLADLFPAITFNLYDTGQRYDFVLESKDNVKLNKMFKPEEWTDRKDVFLISDIRNRSYKRDEFTSEPDKIENERVVWEDMLLQQSWVETVKPVKAHLKFRLPSSYSFIKKSGATRPYLDGIVYRQPWAPKTSTECRLVPYDDLRKRDWDYEHQESMMFYHNVKIRSKYKFYNPVTRTLDPYPTETGLGNDYDSTLTLVIIIGYMTKFGLEVNNDSMLAMFKIFNNGALNGRTSLLKKKQNTLQGIEEGEEEDEEEIGRKK
jgi:hypothetical protein